LLNAKQRRASLRHFCFVDYPRRHRLADGQIDASNQGAVLSCKSDERAAGIDDSDIGSNANARGLCFARFEHPLGIRQRQSDG